MARDWAFTQDSLERGYEPPSNGPPYFGSITATLGLQDGAFFPKTSTYGNNAMRQQLTAGVGFTIGAILG